MPTAMTKSMKIIPFYSTSYYIKNKLSIKFFTGILKTYTFFHKLLHRERENRGEYGL